VRPLPGSPGQAGDDVVGRDMPLQNRVNPFGELFAGSARGTLFGNRGGRFHRDDQTLGRRRWVSRTWICCLLEFKSRQRDVWGRSYTELFFLDEVTALAAGHRPCFECRRQDAVSFADYWRQARNMRTRPGAADMDDVLHAERLDGRAKRSHALPINGLPDGAFVALDDGAFAVRGGSLLHWTPAGYDVCERRPRGMVVDVLTPPAVIAVLDAGFRPRKSRQPFGLSRSTRGQCFPDQW
jgi:hypothetical protein